MPKLHPAPDLDDRFPGHPHPGPAAARMTRDPAAGAALPAGDATEEIRQMIDDLQQTAREMRGELREVEVERDRLSMRLGEALAQTETLRKSERELRSKFVEVTSLIKERDEALAEARRAGQAARESIQQAEGFAKHRHEFQRQRDDSARRLEALKRSADESGALAAEAQKQALAVRQARDAAHSQNLELSDKLARSADQIAELEYDREAAEKTAKQHAAAAADYRQQLEAMAAERSADAAQVEELVRELDAVRQRLLERSADADAGSQHAAALAEALAQVASLTSERDAARTRTQDQVAELDGMREKSEALRDEQRKLSEGEIASAREKLSELESQARDFRTESASLRQQLQTASERIAALEHEATDVASQEHAAALRHERDVSLASLNAAQAQLESLIAERDAALAESAGQAQRTEEELMLLRARAVALETIEEEARERGAEAKELAGRLETQRIESIDIAAQWQTAQREIRELSASLAEARLQVKFAHAASMAAYAGGAKMKEIVHALREPAPEAEIEIFPAGLPHEPHDAFDEREARSAIGAMRQCFQSFTKRPEDFSLLNELYCHVHSFSERTQGAGLLAVHRLAAVFADFTHGLYHNPVQINASTLRSLSQTIEFLALLMREKDLAQLKDPAQGVIYAVDDDPDNCETIRLAMETAKIRTECVLDPGTALAELATRRCDLILLDINLPVMDGFELCAHIRQIEHHATTPIVFLTGLATLENRVQSSLSGGNDFIAKPFNLYELMVKALTHILRAQLHPA